MSQNKFINVMISSRNNSEFDGESLSIIRAQLKEMIEKEKFFGKELFKVWINEEEPTQSFDEDIWDKCLKEVRQADVVIALYNGEAGWIRPSDTLGICHAEVLEATNVARGKVWSITLDNSKISEKSDHEKEANQKFKTFMEQQQLFSKPVKTIKTLKTEIKKTLNDAVINLMQKGVREASRNKGNHGEALLWKNMNYDRRTKAIKKSIQEAIDINGIGIEEDKNLYLIFEEKKVLVVVHAIPDTLSIASAREKVGQPFLDDFTKNKLLHDDIIGPIHIIGCHKSVSETQTRNILGFPDATILKDSFGIYVADNIQKIQMVFIEKCSDSYSVGYGVQNFLEWLERTSEVGNLIQRAESRKKIISVVAEENKN